MLLLSLLAGCGRAHTPAQLLAEARQYQAKGETKAAIIQLKNLLQQTPNDGPARLVLGQLYLDAADVLSAEKEFRRAQASGMRPADLMPALGQSLLLQGQYQKVLDELKALPPQPQPLAALEVLAGHALLGLNRPDEARARFAQALAAMPDHAGALLGQARLALGGRQPDAALLLIEQALAHHPDDLEAWRLKADVLRMQGKTAPAMQAYRQTLKVRPTYLQAHIDIASLLIQTGKLDEARQELGVARQVSSNNLMLLYTQALLDFRENKLASAQEQLQLVLRAAPEHLPSNLLMGAVARSLGNLPQAEQYLRTFLAANPGHPYASKLLAGVLLKNGNPEQAMKLLAPLLDDGVKDVEMMALAGEISMQLRSYTQAARYFEAASALAPQTAALHTALGMSRIGMGDDARAIGELEQATVLDAKSPRAGLLLVLAHLHEKKYEQALAAVDRMLAQQGQNPMALNLKGGVLLMKRDMAGARDSFGRALAIDPLYLPALDNLTRLDLAAKHPDQARLRLETALAKDPKNADLMTALARLAILGGQTASARVWLEKAARENPELLAAALQLAQFDARNGALPAALALAQKLQASNPANADVLALLADIQGRSGNMEAALDSLNKLAVLRPDAADVQYRIAEARYTAHDADGAAQALKKALGQQPDFGPAQAALIRLLIERGTPVLAMQQIRIFQKTAPTALLYKLEGDVLMAQKQIQPALKSYQQAYELSPSGPLLLALHGALVHAGRIADARARVQSWLLSHPTDNDVRLYYALNLMANKDYTSSVPQFEQLLAQRPDDVVALNNLAWLYQQQKDGRALNMAERAYKLAPTNAAVIDTLGWILAGQDQSARALPLLKKAAELAPARSDFRFHLGVALGNSGQRREARAQLEPLLALKDFERRDEVKALLTQW